MVGPYRLQDFISIACKNGVDFAKYTYECGAMDFIDSTYEYDSRLGRPVHSYKFKSFYTDPRFPEDSTHFVLAVVGVSYLLYEVKEEIMIWVCYTEKAHRRQGYISNLLESLKSSYPNKDIVTDSHDESLCAICRKLGIRLL